MLQGARPDTGTVEAGAGRWNSVALQWHAQRSYSTVQMLVAVPLPIESSKGLQKGCIPAERERKNWRLWGRG